MQGGKVTIFSPRPISETVEAAKSAPKIEIEIDQRVVIPPKERN
jgi:hypothetical protein